MQLTMEQKSKPTSESPKTNGDELVSVTFRIKASIMQEVDDACEQNEFTPSRTAFIRAALRHYLAALNSK